MWKKARWKGSQAQYNTYLLRGQQKWGRPGANVEIFLDLWEQRSRSRVHSWVGLKKKREEESRMVLGWEALESAGELSRLPSHRFPVIFRRIDLVSTCGMRCRIVCTVCADLLSFVGICRSLANEDKLKRRYTQLRLQLASANLHFATQFSLCTTATICDNNWWLIIIKKGADFPSECTSLVPPCGSIKSSLMPRYKNRKSPRINYRVHPSVSGRPKPPTGRAQTTMFIFRQR